MPDAPATAVIIPARWESARFPGKPLHPIAGKPLLQHVWERARKASGLDLVLVATDHARIAEAARAFGAEVVMTSRRHLSGTDRVAEAAAKWPSLRRVINVQGDEPLIDPKLISRLARTLADSPEMPMVTAANVMTEEAEIQNPNAVKVVINRAGSALYFSRSPLPYARVAARTPFYRHQGIYGYQADFLQRFVHLRPGLLEQTEQLEQLRALEHGAAIHVLVTRHVSIGVDSPADVPAVEQLLRPALRRAGARRRQP